MHAGVFLPLTRDAAARMCRNAEGADHERAAAVRHWATEVETAAAHCWITLLADSDSAGRWELVPHLHRLTEAASRYAGISWWFSGGSTHRIRVAGAQGRIENAIADGDGQEFAKAFIGYDHAVASTVVCAGESTQRS